MLRASLLLTGASALGSVVSLASQLAVAQRYGAYVAVDAYLIASSIPTLVSGMVGAVFSYALVPQLARVAHDPATFRRVSGRGLLWLTPFITIATSAGYLSAPTVVELLGKALPAEWVALSATMAQISWVWAGLLMLATYLGSVLTAAKKFYLPVVVASLPYVGILVLVAPSLNLGIVAVPIGVLSGWAVATIILGWKARSFVNVKAVVPVAANDIRAMGLQLLAVAGAMSCFTAVAFIDAYWAPELGAGNLSYLGYAQRVLVAAGSLVVAGPAAVLVPHMAELESAAGTGAVRRRLLLVMVVTIGCGGCVAAILGVLAEPAIRVLFQRGTFDATATKGVAAVLPTMLGGMVAMLGVVVLFRGLFQLQKAGTAAALGIMCSLAYWLASGLLSRSAGVGGIAAAYAIAWWLTLTAGVAFLLARVPARGEMRIGLTLLVTVAGAAAATMFVVTLLKPWVYEWGAKGIGESVISLVVAGAVGVAVYCLVIWFGISISKTVDLPALWRRRRSGATGPAV